MTMPIKFNTSDERSRYMARLSLRLAPQIRGLYASRRLKLGLPEADPDELKALLPIVIITLNILQDSGLVELPSDLPHRPACDEVAS